MEISKPVVCTITGSIEHDIPNHVSKILLREDSNSVRKKICVNHKMVNIPGIQSKASNGNLIPIPKNNLYLLN